MDGIQKKKKWMFYVLVPFQISIIQKKKHCAQKTRSEIRMDEKEDIDHSD